MSPSDQSQPWFVRLSPRQDAAIRLYCFPFAGGSASYYRAWAEQAPPEIELTAIQPPGRESRANEAVITKLPRLVSTITRLLVADTDPRPVALFGHCTGGILALETCRALERMNRAPLLLGMSATPPPDHAWWTEGVYPRLAQDPLHSLVNFGGELPEAVRADPALTPAYTELLHNDCALYMDYGGLPAKPVDTTLSVFSSQDDVLFTHAELDAWRAWTTKSTARHRYPGNHFYLQKHGCDITSDLLADISLSSPGDQR